MPAGFQLGPNLNGEEIWKMWHGYNMPEALSLHQISAKYKAEGKINPKTGKPATRAGLMVSAWTWALVNMDEAIPMWLAAWENLGIVMDQNDALAKFAERAKKIYVASPKKYRRWIEEHNLQQYEQ